MNDTTKPEALRNEIDPGRLANVIEAKLQFSSAVTWIDPFALRRVCQAGQDAMEDEAREALAEGLKLLMDRGEDWTWLPEEVKDLLTKRRVFAFQSWWDKRIRRIIKMTEDAGADWRIEFHGQQTNVCQSGRLLFVVASAANGGDIQLVEHACDLRAEVVQCHGVIEKLNQENARMKAVLEWITGVLGQTALIQPELARDAKVRIENAVTVAAE